MYVGSLVSRFTGMGIALIQTMCTLKLTIANQMLQYWLKHWKLSNKFINWSKIASFPFFGVFFFFVLQATKAGQRPGNEVVQNLLKNGYIFPTYMYMTLYMYMYMYMKM